MNITFERDKETSLNEIIKLYISLLVFISNERTTQLLTYFIILLNS